MWDWLWVNSMYLLCSGLVPVVPSACACAVCEIPLDNSTTPASGRAPRCCHPLYPPLEPGTWRVPLVRLSSMMVPAVMLEGVVVVVMEAICQFLLPHTRQKRYFVCCLR